MATQPDSEGWIEWKGGPCPVAPETLVEVRLACDHSLEQALSYQPRTALHWARDWPRKRTGNRIVAYRVCQS